MNNMFYSCEALTSVDLQHFNTQNVTDMSWMFKGCSGLTSLDLKNFDTQNVTDNELDVQRLLGVDFARSTALQHKKK